MLIIERFENNFVILEDDDGIQISIEKDLLPIEAKAGDVIIETSEGYLIDVEQTKNRKSRITSLYRRIKEKNKNL